MDLKGAILADEQAKARWYKLRPHLGQSKLFRNNTRFEAVYPGRRSGKTEIIKRRSVIKIASFNKRLIPAPRFIFAAPTFTQAKKIWWEDLLALIPKAYRHEPNLTELEFKTINGVRVQIAGFDRAQRFEGDPIDYCAIDEFGECKPGIWGVNIRPALGTDGRPGSATVLGVPRGAEYKALVKAASKDPEWYLTTWPSWTILSPEEIRSAARGMDPILYRREYGGEFAGDGSLAYHSFIEGVHDAAELPYNVNQPLYIWLDFNVAPGVAVIAQEIGLKQKLDLAAAMTPYLQPNDLFIDPSEQMFGVIDEVHIPDGSYTKLICEVLWNRYQRHNDRWVFNGDSTGGNRSTSSEDGRGDWDVVRAFFSRKLSAPDYQLVVNVVTNPPEKVRINALNSAFQTFDGTVRLLIDHRCKELVKDLNNTYTKPGTDGQLDKERDKKAYTHMTDALGYGVTTNMSGLMRSIITPAQADRQWAQMHLYA